MRDRTQRVISLHFGRVHELRDGARVLFLLLALVEAIVAHAALGARIGNGEPSLLATDRAPSIV
jgi:hypothetical protein